MATRFYFSVAELPEVGNPSGLYWFGNQGTTGADAGWEDPGAFPLTTPGLTPKNQLTIAGGFSNSTGAASATGTRDVFRTSFVSPPLTSAGRIAGTFSMVIRCSETNASDNASLAVVVRLFSGDGKTLRGTLYSNFNADTEFPLVASAATRIVNAGAITPATAYPGDRLLVELGFHTAVSTTTGNCTLRIGVGAATDFALTSALTTDLNPWCEFSQDLFSTQPNNYKNVMVGNGMSTGERIR